jgi:Tol biopolymer transport system component
VLPAAALAALAVSCDVQRAAEPSARPEAALGAVAREIVYDRAVGGNRDLYAISAGGGPERRLTDHPGEDSLPRFTRDGRRIVFSSDRSGNWQIWELPAEGGEARRVRENAATEWQADVSPDGRRLSFLSNAEEFEKLWVMDLDTGRARALVEHGRNMKGGRAILGNTQWSPDGRRILFSSNVNFGHQIYLVDVDRGKERRLSSVTAGGCEPRFSPDGRKVVYVLRRLFKKRSQLVEHDLATGAEKVLVDWPALNYDPVYSPDGSELAFVSNVARGEFALYRQRLSDGKAWRVTFGPGDVRNPEYRPAAR